MPASLGYVGHATYHDEVERALLVVRAEGEERAVVLVEEELKGGRVLEGPDLVLAIQHLGVGLEELRLCHAWDGMMTRVGQPTDR